MTNAEVVNQTSFARHMREANEHVLEGLALVGSQRMEHFREAKKALAAASASGDMQEELDVSTGLLNVVLRLERRGMDR